MESLIPRVDDLKDVECFLCHKKGHYANMCPESKVKDRKESLEMRQIDDSGQNRSEVGASNSNLVLRHRR